MGFRPSSFATDNLVNTNAAAPSLMELEFAAVTDPSFLNAGLSCGIFSLLPLPGCSSLSQRTSPRRVLTVKGVISASNFPEAIASWAL